MHTNIIESAQPLSNAARAVSASRGNILKARSTCWPIEIFSLFRAIWASHSGPLHRTVGQSPGIERNGPLPAAHHPLIATIVGGIVIAFIFGAIANRLRVSPLVGYLLAGVAVGPFTPGFIADTGLALELAEIGVILLMFGVGLHFSLKDLLSVKAIAIPGAVLQITVATVLGIGLARLMGWSLGAGIVFGLALSVASTVVLLRALQERRMLDSERGRIAVGWLIVEDLAMVLTLVILPPIAGLLGGVGGQGMAAASASTSAIIETLALTLGKVAAFVALMLIVGRRIIPWILHWIAHTGSRELFRLAVLAIALGVAYGATTLFGVSFALGAFFAGMILSESALSKQAASETLPLRDAFAVLFFVSVGMLFDPAVLLQNPWPVLATFLIIVVGKSLAACAIVLAFGHPLRTALTISVSLAQIGEFSFILASLGLSLKLLPEQGRDLILAGAILSILANPLLFLALDRLRPWLQHRETAKAEQQQQTDQAAAAEAASQTEPEEEPESDELVPTSLTDHAIVVGYGRVGSVIAEALRMAGQPFLVIESQDEAVKALREKGTEAILSEGAPADLMTAANAAAAKVLFVAIPNAFEAGQFVEQGRAANPKLEIIARAHFDAEVEHLRHLGADEVVMGEREIARAMVDLARDRPIAAQPETQGSP